MRSPRRQFYAGNYNELNNGFASIVSECAMWYGRFRVIWVAMPLLCIKFNISMNIRDVE